MGRTKQHIPSSEELTEAITKATKETTTKPTAKSMQETLQKDHPDWKVPERRVQKFLKKVTKAIPDAGSPPAATTPTPAGTASDDESMATASSAATNNSRFRQVFGGQGRKSVSDKKAKKNKDKLHNNALPHLSFRKKKQSKKAKKAAAAAAAAAEAAAAEAAAKEEAEATASQTLEMAPPKDEDSPEESLLGRVASDEGEEELLPSPETETKDEVYADDNDGKKQTGVCEGCIIL